MRREMTETLTVDWFDADRRHGRPLRDTIRQSFPIRTVWLRSQRQQDGVGLVVMTCRRRIGGC